MRGTTEPTTTIGKIYDVIEKDRLFGLMIIDDFKEGHWFDEAEDGEQHYSKWFEEVKK